MERFFYSLASLCYIAMRKIHLEDQSKMEEFGLNLRMKENIEFESSRSKQAEHKLSRPVVLLKEIRLAAQAIG